MADNVAVTPGAGASIATDDVGGVQYQRVKLDAGADGVASPVVAGSGLPTAPEGAAINYQPGYHPASEGGGAVATDPSGNLVTRSQILTDEGSFRANFSGASISISIGTCTFTNGSATVAGTALDTYDIHSGDYVKLGADAETAWMQVETFDSPTQLTLVSTYTGTGGTGASVCAIVKPVVGTGGTISASSGQATIACGTTAAVTHELERDVDYGPLLFQTGLSVSQRIANQDIYVGLYDEEHAATPYYYAWFRISGTTDTTVICESGQKRDGAPSGGELETTTITLPNGATTATARRWRIEVMLAKLRFYVDGVLVAEHYKAMPRPMDLLTATVRCVNGTTPATNTNIIVDYITTKNFNSVDVTIPGETEGVIANSAPLDAFTYSVAGAIAINTTLQTFDCRQYRSVMLQCTSMGTSGVVTAQWCDEPTFTTPITATLFSEAGASSTTFNAAVKRYTNVIARYLRLRLTTGASGGTTTIYTHFNQQPMQQWLATQPVSGSVTATGIAGPAAHDAAVSGNPVRIAGRALTAAYTTVATGDTADFITTLQGVQIQKPWQIPELEYGLGDRITASTTATQIRPATASLQNYATAISIGTDTLGAAGDIQLRSTPVASTTATIASNILVMAATYGWKVGDLVYVTASTVTGLTAANYYYILTVSGANLTFSATRGGSTLAISGTTVSATLAKVLWRHKLQTASLPLTYIPFTNPVSGGINLAIEVCTPVSLSSGQVDFHVSGYLAP